jgi:ribosomal protein L7/L12
MATEDDLQRIHERLRAIESNLRRALQQVNLEWMEPTAAEGVPEDVIELAKRGDKIDAIKRYREHTDAGLAEAKEIVDRIVP